MMPGQFGEYATDLDTIHTFPCWVCKSRRADRWMHMPSGLHKIPLCRLHFNQATSPDPNIRNGPLMGVRSEDGLMAQITVESASGVGPSIEDINRAFRPRPSRSMSDFDSVWDPIVREYIMYPKKKPLFDTYKRESPWKEQANDLLKDRAVPLGIVLGIFALLLVLGTVLGIATA